MGDKRILLEGLHRAKDDQKIINDTSFDKNFGMSLYNGFYEHFPMFFTRFASEVDLIGQYHGASIFMICNGPSLASGKYDLTLLKRPGIVTYGMNNGARTIRPNFWTCVDDPQRFIHSIWLDPVITKIVPLTFAEKPIFDNEKWQAANIRVQDCPNVVYFRRNEKFIANRFIKELTVNWGNHKDNGGGRSVMLAVLKIMFLLGFRNVFLMGADFKMSGGYTYHFDEQRSKGAVNGNNDTYQKLMHEYFPALKPQFEAEGFHIFNCNPESELKVFDYVPYEDAIAFASKDLGDVDNERTWGMYSKPDERAKWINEPDDRNKIHLKNIPGKVKTPVFIDKAINQDRENAPSIPMMPQKQQMLSRPQQRQQQSPQQQQQQNDGPVACQVVAIPKSAPMNTRVLAGAKEYAESKNNVQQNIKVFDLNKEPLINKDGRIIRSLPCGGGISFGSSATEQNNITINDNGK